MENDRVNQLVDLLEAVAVELMPTTANNFEKVITNVLQILCKRLDVMISFCRANDHQAGVTVLLAEWPPRPFVPDPDPLAVVPFEANPIFHMSKDLRASFMLCPGDEGSANYCKMIEAATGIPEVTLIVVPLFADDQPTDGVFGLVRVGNQPFDDYERSMLQTVATLLHQAQSRAKAEARLKQTAFVDSLTGLSNRRALEKQLDTAIADRRDFAIVQIGLENIPSINMLYGRQVGDRMLVEVGKVFQQFCDEHTQVFRVGGNGFALLRCASTSQSEILDTAKMVFNKVTHLVAEDEMFVRPRIKLALTGMRPDLTSANDLLAEMKLVLEQQITLESETEIGFYSDAQFEVQKRVQDIEADLHRALAANEMMAYFQPEVNLRTGKVCGCEALLRWNHPERGIVSAYEFIEVAESSGLIVPISKAVLAHAIAVQASWMRKFPMLDSLMRVNVSPSQLVATDIVGDIREQLMLHGLLPQYLCLEVTEHVMMESEEVSTAKLAELREMGVRVAIDDFGIGHSSIAKIRDLPADTLKIDRSFVSRVNDSAADRSLVEAMISMAEAFKLNVVAEGIESLAEANTLEQLGAQFAQGYYFAKPMPEAEMITYLDQSVYTPLYSQTDEDNDLDEQWDVRIEGLNF